MRSKRVAVILALIGAVAAVAVVGTAMAQTPTPNQTKTNYQNVFLDKLAAALNISRDALNSALTTARNETVDQAVQDGKLTQQQADKIKANPNVGLGFGFRFRGGPAPFGKAFGFGWNDKVMNAVAQALGMSTQDLTSKLRSGQTLAQLAQGKEQAVKDAIVGAIKPQLDQAVSNGKMTADQENQSISKIQNSDLSNLHWGFPRVPRNGKNGATPTPNSSFFRHAPAVGSAL